jgi:hypothetical protein
VNQETPSLPGFELTQTFFGLDATHRPLLHKNLFDIVWHSDGRFSWETVYDLPIPTRNLIVRLINRQINPTATDEQTAAEQTKQFTEQFRKNYEQNIY